MIGGAQSGNSAGDDLEHRATGGRGHACCRAGLPLYCALSVFVTARNVSGEAIQGEWIETLGLLRRGAQ
jgi:hypothetical protein